MVNAPCIGIPAALDERRGRRYHVLAAAYPDAVIAAGGSPRVLIGPDLGRIGVLDGLLVPGGDDFLPDEPYPEGVRFDPVPAAQLGFDRALVRAARDAGLPILGICYGMQLLALSRGGRLHHHVPHDLPGASDHGGAGRTVRHRVSVEPGSRLGRILGVERTIVESRHHQAVADPGDLHVSARAEDGVIEAVETHDAPEAAFCIGVQWHPESLEGAPARRLFDALVTAARERSASRHGNCV